LVKDSANEDSVGIRTVKYDVPLVLNAAVSRPNSVTTATDFRRLGKSIEADFQAIEVS